jgi:hypothetical protein
MPLTPRIGIDPTVIAEIQQTFVAFSNWFVCVMHGSTVRAFKSLRSLDVSCFRIEWTALFLVGWALLSARNWHKGGFSIE